MKFFGESVSNRALAISHQTTETERQKLLRKISQVKKQTPVDEERLFALRVDLNYVLVRTDSHCSAGTRRLMRFPALPETKEICCAISTDDRRRINGRRCRVNGGGRSSGGGAGSRPGTNGKGGDLAYTRGRAGCWREGMMLTHVGQLTGSDKSNISLTRWLHCIPQLVAGASSAFGLHRFSFLSPSTVPPLPPPPNELSLACGLSSLVNFSRHRAYPSHPNTPPIRSLVLPLLARSFSVSSRNISGLMTGSNVSSGTQADNQAHLRGS